MSKFGQDRPYVDIVCSNGHPKRPLERFTFMDHAHRPFYIFDPSTKSMRVSTHDDAPRWSWDEFRHLGGGPLTDGEGGREWFSDKDSRPRVRRDPATRELLKLNLDCQRCRLHLPIRFVTLTARLEIKRGGAVRWTDDWDRSEELIDLVRWATGT